MRNPTFADGESAMRRALLLVPVLACIAHAASAPAFTTYPNPACPDSVAIRQILEAGPCQPQAVNGGVGDTVRSIGGILTAVDAIPPSFGFFLQNNASDAGVNAGIEVFTVSRDFSAAPYGFARGDSIVVEWAAVQAFQLNTRLVSPNDPAITPNVVVRKVTSGATLPAPRVLTTTQLRNPESNSASMPWLGSLVQADGPLTVARVDPYGSSTFFLVSPSAPGDSVCVNAFSLTNFVSPPPGITLDMVRGVWRHSTGRHYEIEIRDVQDLHAEPPTAARSTTWGRLKTIYR